MPLFSNIIFNSLVFLARTEASLTIFIFYSHYIYSLVLLALIIFSTKSRTAPDLIANFLASVSLNSCKNFYSLIFSLLSSSMYLIIFYFCPSLILNSSRFFFLLINWAQLISLSYFYFLIYFFMPQTISKWMALRLLSWSSLNFNIFSLLAISQLCLFFKLTDYQVMLSSELTSTNSSSFSSSSRSAFLSSYCILSMVFEVGPADNRNSSLSFTFRSISQNCILLIILLLSLSLSLRSGSSLFQEVIARVNVNPSSYYFSSFVNMTELWNSMGVGGLEPLCSFELSRSLDQNFHVFFFIMDRDLQHISQSPNKFNQSIDKEIITVY